MTEITHALEPPPRQRSTPLLAARRPAGVPAKYKFPGGTALFAIILGAVMIPVAALTVPTYLLFARAHITDTYWAVILPALATPFGVFLMRVHAADAVDTALIEAGRVDGVGGIRIFFTLAFRLLLPGSVTVLLFALVASWNDYFLPLIMLTSPEKFSLPVGRAQWASTATRRVRLAGPILHCDQRLAALDRSMVIAFIFLSRYWQSGLASGGVKA